jgi:hypothetical protein
MPVSYIYYYLILNKILWAKFLRKFNNKRQFINENLLFFSNKLLNQVTQYRHSKVLIMTFIRMVLAGPFELVSVLCRDRQFQTNQNLKFQTNQ